MELSSSSAISDPKEEGRSVDAHATKIVFCCSMNHACIIWQSLLSHQLEALSDVIKKLGNLVEKALSLITGSSELKSELLRIECARSPGFLRLVSCIAVAVLQGKVPDQLQEMALHMLELLKECVVSAYSLVKETLVSDGSMEWFTKDLGDIKPNVVQNPSEVESAAQNVILSLLLQYVLSKEAVEICEAEECHPLLDALRLSVIPSVSIRSKSIITVLEQKTGSPSNFTQIELSSTELEFVAECLFEIAASKLQCHLGFSTIEILQVYQQVIASSPTNMQVFEAFNVLGDDDFMEVQISAEIHAMQLQSNVAVVGNTSDGTGVLSKQLLGDFKSPIPHDADGSLWLVLALLAEVNDLIKTAGNEFNTMEFQNINSVKTMMSCIMEVIVKHCNDEQQQRVANHIAQDKELMGAFLVMLKSSGSFSVLAFGILISLVVELILVQCTNCSEKFRSEFSKAGGLRCLQFQLHKASDNEFNKFTHHIMNGHLAILFQCVYDNPEGMLPMLFKADFVKTMMPLINAADQTLRICSKTVLSLLLAIIDDTVMPCLKLKTDEASRLIELLSIAAKGSEASEGLLTYSVVQLLTSLINLLSLAANQLVILKAGIMKPLKSLILSEDYTTQEQSLRLLWVLLSERQFSCQALTDHPELCDLDVRLMLQFIQQSPSLNLSLIAQCALKTIYWDAPEDVHSWFQYAYTSFVCGHLDNCISWSRRVLDQLKESEDPLINNCKLLLGKSLAQKYSREQRLLEIRMEYFSATDLGRNKAVKDCYEKAKNAILHLGYSLDNGILDDEGSMLLDFAMIDYAREINALNKCNRCLLCRKWGKLCRSHICPESLLKEIAKANFEEGEDFTVASMTGKPDIRTPGTETKWLLCGTCEQLLSRHGETQFAEKFFRLLYPEIRSTAIKYDEELYNFCVGVAFRALCLTNFSDLYNRSEIYSLFVACRKHLSNIASKYHQYGYGPPETQGKPEFFTFRNPVGLYSTEGVREDILSGVLQSSYVVHISPYHLKNGDKSIVAGGCFFMAIIGGITMLTKFSPDQSFMMPQSFVPISPDGGEYLVPSEVQRWMDIPPGMMEILKESVISIQSRISERFWGKLPVPNKHKPTIIPKSWDTEISQQPDPPLPDTLKELQVRLLSGIVQEAVTVVNLLPEGFNISRKSSFSRVTLPLGHAVLKHAHSQEKQATLLLATDGNDCYKTYVIAIQQRHQRELIYGFHLQADEEHYIIKDLLVTTSVEGAKSAFLQGVVSEITDILQSLWSNFDSFHAMAHHSRIGRVSESFSWVSLDSKCSDNGCWYCKNLCHNCMKPAGVGYTKMAEGVVYKHCSEHCKSLHFDNLDEIPFQADLVHLKVNGPPNDIVLLQATKVASTKMSTNTVLSIQLCLSCAEPKIPDNAPYALLQIRTKMRSVFLSFLILPDLSPGEHLWYTTHPQTIKSIDNIRKSGLVQEILQLAFTQNNIPDLSSFVMNSELCIPE